MNEWTKHFFIRDDQLKCKDGSISYESYRILRGGEKYPIYQVYIDGFKLLDGSFVHDSEIIQGDVDFVHKDYEVLNYKPYTRKLP